MIDTAISTLTTGQNSESVPSATGLNYPSIPFTVYPSLFQRSRTGTKLDEQEDQLSHRVSASYGLHVVLMAGAVTMATSAEEVSPLYRYCATQPEWY
jgi:hypothetical protein